MRVLVSLAWVLSVSAAALAQSAAPESRAVAFLVKAVEGWHGAQGCYSCHHNGDAARALLLASHRGHDVGKALDETRAFLATPAQWAANKSHGDDEALMRLQFAAALAADGERDLHPAKPLEDAATLLLADQQPDGSWVPDASDGPGSPLTWGTALATSMARATLMSAGRQPDDFAVAQTDRWLRTVEASTVTDAAGIILGLGMTSDVMTDKQRAACLNLLRFAQRDSGGWGAEPNAEAATVFDTALVVIALQQLDTDPRLARSTFRPEELKDAIARGRAFSAQQQPDGGWPETMRGAPGPVPHSGSRRRAGRCRPCWGVRSSRNGHEKSVNLQSVPGEW
ncbi:MAG: hypothetical protein R2712_29470 [Vicinamibacterales bacterium]